MAKLILNKAEKSAANYLEWDNEALGMAVKKLALGITDHHQGEKATAYTACAVMLASMAADRDAETTVIELTGVRDGELEHGDWRIVITRSASRTETAEAVKSKVVGRIGNRQKN